MLPNNHSLLVDLGSYINVIGRNTMLALKRTAEEHGRQVKLIPRKARTNVDGVGTDPAICGGEAVVPIAVKSEGDSGTSSPDHYQANVAYGCGIILPAIMGGKSMKETDAVIILREGTESMAFPGTG